MANKNKPLSFSPKDGGQLMTRASAEVAGFGHYTIKRDFRRDFDQDIRAEGHSLFRPNLEIEIGDQPYPQRQDFAIAGFENGGLDTDNDLDGFPDGWVVSVGAGITFARDSSVTTGAASTHSAKFVSTTAGATGYLQSESFLPATVGRFWRLRWAHKVSTATLKVLVEVKWYDAAQAELASSPVEVYASANGNPTGSFQNFTFNVTVPGDAAYGKVRFYGKDSGSSVTGTIWFDDISLEESDASVRPINLLHQVKRPNGQMAVVAGTATTLYRYRVAGDGDYFAFGDGSGYFVDGYVVDGYTVAATDLLYVAEDYVDNGTGGWTVIASGLAEDGRRWEPVSINGYGIFNNAADLPLTYRVEDGMAVPNYEMREAGIALVGTIWEHNGILFAGDVAVLKGSEMEANFAHVAGAGELRQHGAKASQPFTATKATGYAVDMVGGGGSKRVTFADSATLEPSVDFSIEATIKPITNPDAGDYYYIFGKTDSYRFSVASDDGVNYHLVLEVWNSAAPITLASSFLFTAAPLRWINVAVTVLDGNLVTFFIDGNEVDSVLSIVNSPDTNANGAQCGLGTFFSGMQIAECRLWFDARSADEIRDNQSVDVTGQADLSAYWRFEEGTGGTTADATGNGNTGTLAGGATWVASDSPSDSYIEMKSLAAIAGGLTRVATTATFQCVSTHKLTTGDLVLISGASDAAYNGLFTVTVTDPLTFTYTIVGAPATPDPGSPVVQRALFGTATFNYDGLVGKTILMANGFRAVITGVVSTVRVQVNESVADISGNSLFQIINASDTTLTGTVTKNGTTAVVGVGTAFESELYPGASILIPGGAQGDEVRIVASITDDTNLTVTEAFAGSATGQTAQQVSDYYLLSDTDYFELSMVGKHIFFDNGSFRKITRFVDERMAETASYFAVEEQGFLLENTTAYDRITNASLYDRIQFRRVWSSLDEPLRFAASTPGSMTLGSRKLELQWQARSFKAGDELLVTGAGTNGGNLTATIVYAHPNHTTFMLDEAARATTVNQPVARSDASGSISGFDDLQDDGSAIVKGLSLRGTMVVYKDTSIFLDRFTGNALNPFDPRRVYQGSKTPFYRDTVIDVDGEFHVYAGRNAFYRFDLVAQVPKEFLPLERCSDIFYSQATLEDAGLIFAWNNVLTKEVFVCFPSDSADKGLCYDYQYGTCRTTGAAFTAGASIKKPQFGLALGVIQDWAVMGNEDGAVMRFGRSDTPDAEWGGREVLILRNGSGYESRLKSGLYGDRFHETTITEWMAELASQAYPNATACTLNLYGYRNAAEAPVLLLTKALPTPHRGNLVPMMYRRHFFQDEIVVTGSNNPFRLAARTIAISKVGSRGQQKAGL